MFVAFLLAMSLSGAEPAPASTEAETTAVATAEKPSKPGGDRLVCRREAKANSRFTTKICKTADEWEQRAETARQSFGETQSRPMVDISRGN
jgi:hypothetical protein